jgi:hypothetical protein
LPVSTLWQWQVSGSSCAVVIFRSPNTFDHPESSGRDDDTGALIELAQQMEQQRNAPPAWLNDK